MILGCVYPYEYVDLPQKLLETKLPPQQAFYSLLKDEDTHISEVDCKHFDAIL